MVVVVVVVVMVVMVVAVVAVVQVLISLPNINTLARRHRMIEVVVSHYTPPGITHKCSSHYWDNKGELDERTQGFNTPALTHFILPSLG